MTILYLLTRKPDPTFLAILSEQKKLHKVETIDLGTNREYDKIVDSIVAADKVISW
ncbi:MAG: hypothetical protein P1P81_03020 [Desulfobulbales bacterium]|nr:hypothetical protein [Desulfobulbales bacterium]